VATLPWTNWARFASYAGRIEPDLRVRAAALMLPPIWIGWRPAWCPRSARGPATRCSTAAHNLHVDLVRPRDGLGSAILERLWRALERYVRVGYQRMEADTGSRPQRLARDSRPGSPPTMRRRRGNPTATLRNIDVSARIAEGGLAESG